MKKILITGASGFIGRNLKEGLENEFNVYAPSSKELDLLNTEKLKKYLKEHKFDVVIHAATHNATRVSDKDLSQVFKNNLLMFFNLARLNSLYGRMFYFGSGAEYDKRYPIVKAREIDFDKRIPVDDYGFSKYIMAKYIKNVDNVYDLRLFGVFGKYEDWRIRFISNAICRVIYDMNITISKNVYFDYLYMGDLIKIVKYFIDKKEIKHKEYNVCTGKKIDLVTLGKKVKELSKKKSEVRVAKEGLGKEYSGDNSRLLKEIGEFKFTPLDESIRELYKWYFEKKIKLDKQEITKYT
ncbi:MAG: NAD dependent epimerase/dehydratase family [Candidatus Woesebacteria bacterium GW2011_GWB1_39_10]|uniref:NAD dependent epimerase/dehydratase family n=1 Tax=Candidatus Woesebacteria bacterium GW2011_GWB1_39_10 TaxID=1618572 RepID=A0A0G0PPY0_9BACT|nr:MAG: NAD dependent epimerase/dehydratase family [Candidatus Woesebacteria bacterium GW2011_GWB1_39_10]